MKYTCRVKGIKTERPLTVYTNSLAEARRWSKDIIRINPSAKVDICETTEVVLETISGQQVGGEK